MAPFAVGPLAECRHCVHDYLALLPVVPGILFGAASSGWQVYAIAGLATVVLLAAGATLLRECGRRWRWLLLSAAALGSGAQAMLLTYGMRM